MEASSVLAVQAGEVRAMHIVSNKALNKLYSGFIRFILRIFSHTVQIKECLNFKIQALFTN
jgi:hypothetical protein